MQGYPQNFTILLKSVEDVSSMYPDWINVSYKQACPAKMGLLANGVCALSIIQALAIPPSELIMPMISALSAARAGPAHHGDKEKGGIKWAEEGSL